MTQANFKPKVSTITGGQGVKNPSTSEKKLKSQEVRVDSYSDGKSDDYKAIIKGSTTTAESTPIGELVSALYDSQNRKYKDPLQECLYGMLYGLDSGTPALPEEVNVPSFEKLKAENTGIAESSSIAEGIVDRYYALEDLIEGTIGQVEQSLKPENTVKMTPAEVESLQEYRKELEGKLFSCRQECTKARYTLACAEANEEAAAQAAIEAVEKDWWED